MDYILPYFEKIDTEQLKEYYHTDVVLNGLEISVDLNFKDQSISKEGMDLVHNFLMHMASFNERNRVFIKNDFDSGGEAAEHIAFYLDEFDSEELVSVITIHDATASPELLLLEALKLVRIGLYPDDGEYFAIFDYAIFIDGEPSNQLLVINTDAQGELDHITWES